MGGMFGNYAERGCFVCGRTYKPAAPRQKVCGEKCRIVRARELAADRKQRAARAAR